MTKYIPANKLIAEIERRKKTEGWCEVGKDTANVYYARGFRFACDFVLNEITSLQQEQPDKYETALEKAREWMPNVNQGGHAILIDIFPELGEGLDPRYGGRKQEQPEVDLEKEIEKYFYDNFAFISSAHTPTKDIVSDIANHFYELGLNARK